MNIGIIGGGQLGRMLVMEGRKLGFNFSVIDSTADSPAGRIADRSFQYENYQEFIEQSDVITFEFEHIDSRVLEAADLSGKLFPGKNAIMLKRDRADEKNFLKKIGVPTADFIVAEQRLELAEAVKSFDESVLKSASGGYDGKGQYRLSRNDPIDEIPDQKYVVEQKIDFDYEASAIFVSDIRGKVIMFTPSYNLNRKGILLLNRAPIADPGFRSIGEKIMHSLGYVGAMGIEFFVVDGKPMVNEIAPRVHNTGHHTLMGSTISQFEAHLRAITGLPLNEPELLSPSGIVNLIGRDIDSTTRSEILSIPGTVIYWYCKDSTRIGRKMGHVNVAALDEENLKNRMERVMEAFYGEDPEKYL